jgi:hypothetical protein
MPRISAKKKPKESGRATVQPQRIVLIESQRSSAKLGIFASCTRLGIDDGRTVGVWPWFGMFPKLRGTTTAVQHNQPAAANLGPLASAHPPAFHYQPRGHRHKAERLRHSELADARPLKRVDELRASARNTWPTKRSVWLCPTAIKPNG